MKQCVFHQALGHTTEECNYLRDLIESLVRSNTLAHFALQVSGGRGGGRGDFVARGHGLGQCGCGGRGRGQPEQPNVVT